MEIYLQTWWSVTIFTLNIVSTIINTGEDEEGLGRWSYMTYGCKNQKRITIISVYRTCVPKNNQGVSTAHS